MKYFVLGALASGLLLYGMSMIYGATGTLEITGVADLLYANKVDKVILGFGIVFLVAGIAFKLGVVPFHMWIPDVYHGAPTAVTLFIASAPKLAAFAIVIRMLVNGLILSNAPLPPGWQSMLLILSLLSMAVGNFAAIAQSNLKRMLAYSAISHMGFMLLGLATGYTENGAAGLLSAYSASMFYVVTYVLTSAGAFGMILLLSRAGFESDEIKDFAGLNKRNPWFAAVMMMMMFSMAGGTVFRRFLCQILGPGSACGRRSSVACRRRRVLLAGRCVLLPACGQSDVLRSAGRNFPPRSIVGREGPDFSQWRCRRTARDIPECLDDAVCAFIDAIAAVLVLIKAV